MAYADIKVRQSAEFVTSTLNNQTFSITLASPTVAGNALVLVGNALRADQYQGVSLSSVASTVNGSAGNTWGTITNYDSDASTYATRLWAVVAENIGAGTTVVTGTLSVTATQNLIGARLFEIEGVATSSTAAFSPVTARSNSSVNAYTDTGSSGTLPQTDCLLIGISAGAYGNPSNEGTWTEQTSVTNGGGYIGCQIGTLKTAATTAVAMRTLHDSAVTAYRGTILLGLKAKVASTRQYRFAYDSTKLNNTSGTFTCYVLRNGDCDTVLAEKFTGVSATAGGIVICTPAPAGALLTDAVKVMIEGTTLTSGWVAGSVEDA